MQVGMFEAKAKLSELVSSGKVITITNHRKPVAKIVPIVEYTPAFLAELERQCERVEALELNDDWQNYQDESI